MKKCIKRLMLGMCILSGMSQVYGWEKMTTAEENKSVRIIKKVYYVKPEKVEKAKILTPRIYQLGDMSGMSIDSSKVKSSQYVDLYLDLDGNPKTTEAVATVCTDCPDAKMKVCDMKEGDSISMKEIFSAGNCYCRHKHLVEVFCRE